MRAKKTQMFIEKRVRWSKKRMFTLLKCSRNLANAIGAHADVHAPCGRESILHVAARSGAPAVCRRLVRERVDVNIEADGSTLRSSTTLEPQLRIFYQLLTYLFC